MTGVLYTTSGHDRCFALARMTGGAGLEAYPDKCNICRVEVEYLGNLIGRAGVRPTAEKTQALEKWPTPQSVTELKSFLGLLGFLRRYIADLAQISAVARPSRSQTTYWSLYYSTNVYLYHV